MNNDITKINIDASTPGFSPALNEAVNVYNATLENFDVNSSVELQNALRSSQEAIMQAQQAAAQAQATYAQLAAGGFSTPIESVVPDLSAIPTAASQDIAQSIQAAELQRAQFEQQAQAAELQRLQMEQQMAQQAAAQTAVQAQSFSSTLDKEIDIVNLNPTTGANSAPAATTIGNVSGNISPGTTQSTFAAKSYNLSPSEFNEFLALVYSEASERPDYITSDSMAVASSVLNRLESGNYGSTLHDVMAQKGQYAGYHNHKFNTAIKNPGVVKPEMVEAVKKVLNGQRNTIARSFSGNGVHNSFR